jgi:hypothetical protein
LRFTRHVAAGFCRSGACLCVCCLTFTVHKPASSWFWHMRQIKQKQEKDANCHCIVSAPTKGTSWKAFCGRSARLSMCTVPCSASSSRSPRGMERKCPGRHFENTVSRPANDYASHVVTARAMITLRPPAPSPWCSRMSRRRAPPRLAALAPTMVWRQNQGPGRLKILAMVGGDALCFLLLLVATLHDWPLQRSRRLPTVSFRTWGNGGATSFRFRCVLAPSRL